MFSVAVEAKYHKNCFALYVTKKTLHHHANDQSDSPHERAFQEMTTDISQGLDQGKAYDMGSLLTRYREILEEKGVQGDSYTTQRLKVRLEKHFGDSVVFHQPSDKTKPELLYSSSIQVQDVLNGWAHLKKPKEREKGPDEDATKERDIARVASCIKAEIRKCKGITSRPLDVEDISQESTREVIPDSLYWIIRLIISPDDDRCLDRSSVCTNMVDERQVLSIAQDVIHCCTNGRVKLPKHASLAICVFHLTSSRNLLTLLNRMGHCCSYNEMRAVDTSIALEVLAHAEEHGTVIPSNISPGPLVQIAADNNDFTEETLDGKNTTHATTMVVNQRKALWSSSTSKGGDHATRRRSLQTNSSLYMADGQLFLPTLTRLNRTGTKVATRSSLKRVVPM